MNELTSESPILRLGTRQSPLALAQAREARSRLCKAHGWPEDAIELVPVRASGDRVQDRPLAEIGGKALWTKELDEWLVEGRIDAAVHSMKDVETIRPIEFAIGAILPRADRRDVLVGATSINAIPQGATVGTSAPRRAAQLLNSRPDCNVVTFRGNVATRLAKLQAGEVDATFLAAAGLERLGELDIGTPMDIDGWLPAAGQGAIGIEFLAGNARVLELLATIDDQPGHFEVDADRAFLKGLGGTCHSPVAVDSVFNAGKVHMTVALFSSNGAERLDDKAEFPAGDKDRPNRFAQEVLGRASPAIARNFGKLE